MKLPGLLKKYQDIISYLFFGGCTTIVNVAAYWVMAHLLNCSTLLSTMVAWVIAVLFAYITNRKWVFHSETRNIWEILKEAVSFFLCRIATGVVDWASMWLFVDIGGINDVAMKFLTNIIVIVLNFIASKCIIFKHNKHK